MECEKCGGDMWDNRGNKRNPKSPDFKCKDKECGHGTWTKGGGSQGGKAPAARGGAPKSTVPLALVYSRCLKWAAHVLPPIAKEAGATVTAADIQAVAATLFISHQQHGDRPVFKAPPPPPPKPKPKPEPEPEPEDPGPSEFDGDDELPF